MTSAGAVQIHMLTVSGVRIFPTCDAFALKFIEQIRWQFADNVDQHVEATAMRHADDDFFDALLATVLYEPIEQRDGAFAAFERKALLADVLFVQILLQRPGGNYAVQNFALFISVEPPVLTRLTRVVPGSSVSAQFR